MYSVDKRSADGVTEAMEDGGITFILQICGYSTGKSFSGVGNNFVRALATEIENKEEYEFLKGNKELEAIFFSIFEIDCDKNI